MYQVEQVEQYQSKMKKVLIITLGFNKKNIIQILLMSIKFYLGEISMQKVKVQRYVAGKR
jgi:hypothetical protein